MLTVRGLQKAFGSQLVLSDIDMEIREGEVTALLGTSGAGKTTLLRCLNFLETADAGTITFGGGEYRLEQVTKAQIRQYRMKTAFVFQNFNLFLNKTALENVMEGLVIARGMRVQEARRIAEESLDKVGLSDRMTFYPQQLSGGQQQRVAIARAVATHPEIIFLDEPTSALDPELTKEVLSVIRYLATEGMTMLVVTHEIPFARSVSKQVIFMDQGRIVESGDAARIFTNPSRERTRSFLKIGE
ncbi:MAG: amino acid ABC transporter ATP-binding protein [Lachnospiraceae bacterium]|nr:amino acid ABC transporter ATP-binding protein [Lachnospiraceae bacterium]